MIFFNYYSLFFEAFCLYRQSPIENVIELKHKHDIYIAI
jgi:hypothetical protein